MSLSNHKKLPATGEDTIGPYYPLSFLDEDRSDLTQVHFGLRLSAKGHKICLQIKLLDCHGVAIQGALLEFWQANSDGLLRTPSTLLDEKLDPHFDGYSRQRSNDGHFQLLTIKPGVINQTTTGLSSRAPHITLNIFCDGITRVVTQVFFDDEESNDNDPLMLSLPKHLRQRLIAKKTATENDVTTYQLDIVMKGENETPFFDDIDS